MKSLFTVISLFILNLVQGQFQQRFNLDYTVPLLRNERFNSGIKTSANFSAGNPANFYYAGIGTSYNRAALPPPHNIADRMRFTLLGTTGAAVFSNKGHQFSIGDGPWLNASGNSIAEISNGAAGNGGYVAVGAVTNNTVTEATVAGGSDVLFTQLNAAGDVIGASRIDLNNRKDIAWYIRRSRVVTTTGQPTWIMCGQSTSTNNNNSDCFVARVRSDGTIIWSRRYNFPTAGGNATYCIAKQLCEDANADIYVVGTRHVPGVGNIDGLAFQLSQAGVLAWARNYNAGTDDKFQAVRLTNAGASIIAAGFTNNGGTYNMLLVQLNTANGNINFQRVLRAQDAAGNTYPSQCHDVVQTPGGEYFLAGFLIKNGVTVQMMYKTAANGAGINWYSYNKMLYNVGFGLDYVNGATPGIAFFSSIKNLETPTFSDSHIMKTDLSGRTCPSFCSPHPPSTLPVNLHVDVRTCIEMNAGTRQTLNKTTYDYDEKQICNNPNPCPAANLSHSANKPQAPGSYEQKGGIKVSPNPVYNTLRIRFYSLPAGEYQLTLLNMEGKTVLQKNDVYNNGSSVTDLDVSSFAPGVYVLTIRQGTLVLQQNVVKQYATQ